jgi:hypothetical protein
MREDYIFQFDIAVDEAVRVHVLDAPGDLPDDNGCGFLGESASLLEQIEEMSVAAQFHKEVDVVCVAEEVVEFDEVGVVQNTLDANFADQLL